jgi:hypothetical protein
MAGRTLLPSASSRPAYSISKPHCRRRPSPSPLRGGLDAASRRARKPSIFWRMCSAPPAAGATTGIAPRRRAAGPPHTKRVEVMQPPRSQNVLRDARPLGVPQVPCLPALKIPSNRNPRCEAVTSLSASPVRHLLASSRRSFRVDCGKPPRATCRRGSRRRTCGDSQRASHRRWERTESLALGVHLTKAHARL